MKFLVSLLIFLSCWAHAEPSILVVSNSGNVVTENANEVRPLASITKLMTAMVVLDSVLNLDSKAPLINRWSTVLPKKSYSQRDLLTATLVRSDNSAAESLAHAYPGGRDAFMRDMNAKARQLNMTNTHFLDPTGLSVFNVSTAIDIQKMLTAAQSYPLIRAISTMKDAQISNEDKKKMSQIAFSNTNKTVLTNFTNIVITKTGLTNAAGWCVGLVVEEKGQNYYIVILGSKTKQSRLDKIKELMYNYVI
jgi:D-alanyl-D-alanine endopeptidase (penicillin-binding protein 7)